MSRKPVSLVVAMTLALGTFLLVAGLLVLSTLFYFVSSQLRHHEESAAREKSAFLAQTFTVSLWNYALNDVQTVGDVVARDEGVLSLRLTTDTGAVAYVSPAKTGPLLISIRRDLSFRGQPVGTMLLSASAVPLYRQMATLIASGASSFFVFVALLLAISPYVMGRTILRPFETLARTLAQETDSGHFPDLPAPRSRIREIRLFETVLYELNQRVGHQMDVLEEQVAARTQELQSAQARIVRSETLAHMGQLAATVAHELNTPLGASLSTAENWESDLYGRWIPRLAASFSLPGNRQAEQLLLDVARLSGDLTGAASRTERKRLSMIWMEKGHDPDSDLFDLLTSTSAVTLFDEIAQWPPHHPAFGLVLDVGRMARDLSIIRQASIRAAEVVQGLRAQLTPSNTDRAYPVNLTAVVQQALSLVKGRFSRQLRLEWEAPRAVWVLGNEGDLIRMATNLMTNAVQAMEGSGTLEICVEQTETEGLLTITDTGPGVPQELQERIFDPFFTTKETGLGLGLDLVKRVVSAFHGELRLVSRPGLTSFTASLPRPPEGQGPDEAAEGH